MAIVIPNSGGNYPPCPEGEYNAVCVDVVDLGMVTSVFDGREKTQPKILVVWQTSETDTDGLPYLVFKRYTASMHKKAKLYEDLTRWFKKDFDKIEAAVKKDVEMLLGKGARVEIEHNESNGKTYANVVYLRPLDKSETPKQHPAFVRKKDRKEGDGPFGGHKAARGAASDPEDHDHDEDFS